MKKLLTILFAFIALSATAQKQPEKKDTVVYTMKYTEAEFGNLFNVLEFSKKALPTSKAPAVDVTAAIATIEEIQKPIVALYNEKHPQPVPEKKNNSKP